MFPPVTDPPMSSFPRFSALVTLVSGPDRLPDLVLEGSEGLADLVHPNFGRCRFI
jgi:hypothetical protein